MANPDRESPSIRRLDAWPSPSLGRAIADAGSSPTRPIFVARQPIYDQRLEVRGYEMLFRAPDADGAETADAESASAATILSTFADIGLDALVGRAVCMLNVTRELVLSDVPALLPPERVAFEVSRAVAADPAVQPRLRELAERGFAICIDDFVVRPDSIPLLEVARMAKLDVRAFTAEQLARQVRALADQSVELVAVGIEDHETFERCRDSGFQLFQGPFLSRPKTVAGKGIPSNRASQMQLVATLNDPNAELEDLDGAIANDLGVSYRLLRFINSAYFALPRRVSSIHDAVVMLGAKNVRSWAMLVALATLPDQPSELVRTALVRARMCELVGKATGAHDAASYFTIGLFSVVDALMGMRMEDVLEELPLAPELTEALLDRSGPMGDVLSWVVAYEGGQFARLGAGHPAAERALRDAYVQAIAWADHTLDWAAGLPQAA